jgi:nucleotide-binding universal stress UspA family protein
VLRSGSEGGNATVPLFSALPDCVVSDDFMSERTEMHSLRHLLAATDGSERAERAESRAAQLCQQHKITNAELLSIRESGEPDVLAMIMNTTVDGAREEVIARASDALLHRAGILNDNYGIEFSCQVRFGKTATEIVQRAEETNTDLLVIGAHGGNFFSDLLLGNTADRLVHLCKCPLLVVKNNPRQAYQRVLIPVDFSEESRGAAQVALTIAPNAGITFLHAFEVLFEGKMRYAGVSSDVIKDYRLKAHEEARVSLNRFIHEVNTENRQVSSMIIFGIPGPVVREHAKATRPDLIALGKHGRSRFEELILGSVTRDTLEQTESDVLVVPSRKN